MDQQRKSDDFHILNEHFSIELTVEGKKLKRPRRERIIDKNTRDQVNYKTKVTESK